MRFTDAPVDGAFIIDLAPHTDARGFFARAFCADAFAEHGLDFNMVQMNLSYSTARGTLRGLHYQTPPHDEAKLVRCIHGAVYDVVADVRPHSPTFLDWMGVALSANNRRMVYVPPGCAHGFLTLTDDAEVLYPVSEAYAPEHERGLRYDDPAVAIDWPAPINRISDKDRAWPNIDPLRRSRSAHN